MVRCIVERKPLGLLSESPKTMPCIGQHAKRAMVVLKKDSEWPECHDNGLQLRNLSRAFPTTRLRIPLSVLFDANLLNERGALTADVALRIEKSFGPKMDHLMRMQLAYDLAAARERERTIKVKRYARRTDAG